MVGVALGIQRGGPEWCTGGRGRVGIRAGGECGGQGPRRWLGERQLGPHPHPHPNPTHARSLHHTYLLPSPPPSMPTPFSHADVVHQALADMLINLVQSAAREEGVSAFGPHTGSAGAPAATAEAPACPPPMPPLLQEGLLDAPAGPARRCRRASRLLEARGGPSKVFVFFKREASNRGQWAIGRLSRVQASAGFHRPGTHVCMPVCSKVWPHLHKQQATMAPPAKARFPGSAALRNTRLCWVGASTQKHWTAPRGTWVAPVHSPGEPELPLAVPALPPRPRPHT